MIPGITAGAPAEGVGPSGMDDDFSGASLGGKWTRRANGASSVVLSSGVATFTADPASPSPTVHQMYQGVPGVGIWSARAAGHAATNFAVVGMHVRDSVGGRVLIIGWHNNGAGRRLLVILFNNETTFGGTLVEEADPDPDAYQYLQIEVTATNIILRHSLDGATWVDKLDVAFGVIGGGFNPDQIGFAVSSFGAGTPTLEIDQFTQDA